MTTFKVGDRVEYKWAGSGVGNLSWNGRKGVIVKVHDYDSVGVLWDCGSLGAEHPRVTNLILLSTAPTAADIDNALAVLSAAGAVTFKANKPPFRNILLRVNEKHSAVVTTVAVTVGCQRVSFEAVEELYAAVQKAREYNAL